MELKILQADLIKARKEHDDLIKGILVDLVAAVKKAAIDKGIHNEADITSDIVDAAILKEKKIAQEQVDTCPEDREGLRDAYSFRLNIINSYAPQLITSPAEISHLIHSLGIELIPTNRGAIMKALKGKVDMKNANAVLKEIM